MIEKSTIQFLKDLSLNNNREWFNEHKDQHDRARENVLDFAGQVIAGLSKTDLTIPPDLDPKGCVMRIYRDVRFSKNKAPYKNNFGAGISANGKNFNGAGYYLHISPKECFIAGGCWMPEAGMLKAIRQEIDYNAAEFREIINEPSFKEYFGEPDQEFALKTTPKGYDADHPEIAYLRLKSYTFTHELSVKELTSPGAVESVVSGFEKMYPFIVFLRNAVS